MTQPESNVIRPLRRVGYGHWRSRDEHWTFLRHQSDPHPQRWYVFETDDDYPCNDGSGITTLGGAVEWVEAELAHEASR